MPAASNDTIIRDSTHYGCIAVDGDDATSFLQGQLTCDMSRIEQDISPLVGYCNPQGRLLACLRLSRQSDHYLLRLPRELTAPILQRLRLFVLRSKVNLYDASDEQDRIGPDRQLTEIRVGLPEIYPATQNTFIPQMVNLDLIGGVAFDKGCYVGQEIIARTHYLGRLKRRMYRLHSERSVSLHPGDMLDTADESRPAGQIVRAVTPPGAGTEMLAVMTMAELPESGLLQLRCHENAFTARIEPLPYPIPPGG